MISMDKIYMRADGVEAIVKFTDGPSSCPVGVITHGVLLAYNHDGQPIYALMCKNMQLVEVSPFDEFTVDEKVMVRVDIWDEWQHAYFAGVEDGTALAFCDGATKWSSLNKSTSWLQCRRPTAEELAA